MAAEPTGGGPTGPARFHWLRLRGTAHPTEDVDRVATAMAFLLDDEAATIEVTAMPTQHGATAHLLEAEVTRNRAVRDAASRLFAHLTPMDLEARLDDEGTLYARFAKQDAYRGDLEPASGDDTIQVRCRIQAHPATRDNALAAWRDLFQ